MIKLFIIIFFFLFHSSYSQTGSRDNCDKFKNGEFKITADSISPETKIIRKGNLQIETIGNADGAFEFIVTWLDNCIYTLTPTEKTFKKYPELPKNACLTVKIIEVRKDSYIQTSSSNFADYEITSEVIKLK